MTDWSFIDAEFGREAAPVRAEDAERDNSYPPTDMPPWWWPTWWGTWL
jgi:hypothetical protein